MANADASDRSAPVNDSPAAVEGPDFSRRQVLRLGSGGALALVIGAGAGWLDRSNSPGPESASPRSGNASATPTSTTTGTTTTTTSTTTTTTEPMTVSGIGEVDPRIIALGQRVVAVTGENDIAELLARLPTAERGSDPLERAAARVRADFEQSDTITVDGWILAASEARAAAVIALACSQSVQSRC
ncbi:MAG: hypothetical protein OXB92_12610 [Acidimicrobiaceae bacterium]|nr:hypothetical protein [Acidimicrobiia bacterium]MCY4494689.1 hypothetical protein [Acidimicrobiaceae bacterium]